MSSDVSPAQLSERCAATSPRAAKASRYRIATLCQVVALPFALILAVGARAEDQSASNAGQAQREIKSLSPQDVQALLAGKGMGYAKAAELNGYPGPSHVLQLAGELQLSAEQLAASRRLFESMNDQARSLGATLVAAERELDELFASGRITADSLAQRLRGIGALQAQIRGAHLAAHLQQSALLSVQQHSTYARLRGYTEPRPGDEPSHQHGR